ncbi:uncharacterized protein LOC120673136 isoform X3 [Panicum virgatum]|uniref:Transcription factor IIIC 90kDa subunit N-terminal domain-containing protein n=1 Tax=Panicum virgatum TaxID=38727 RepID=A0A8T0S0S1_PANVG|nr:uncharacterized protein LOC120673136 isoform X3 [Panicum virgatum]KAG2591480.1 hypothetical protein PVAP13_5NG448100 [Panicum virgatum]KAG2591482.1 hypothetical protein PVAP13_5NG448100 [Panicum virgatum]
MAPQYQAVTLIASPSYPNAIAWSSDNLVAVASGHIVTILNPAALDGPRGVVGLRRSDPFPIGVVNREDLFEPCLVPTCLARDAEPCARSISWSPQGFAPNSGCLLAVCTVDGHVKLYRSPIWEICDEWVQVADLSQLLFSYYKTINFGEDNGSHLTSLKNINTEETEVLGSTCELQDPLSRRDPGQRKRKPPRVDDYIYDGNKDDLDASNDADFSLKPCSKSKKKSSKKTAKHGQEPVSVNGQGSTGNSKASLSSNGGNKSLPLITAKQYACRDACLSSLVVAWSPLVSSSDKISCLLRHWCVLAVGSKSGNVYFWKLYKPEYYTIDAGVVNSDPMLIGVLQAHKSWVSAITWEVSSEGSSTSSLLLATGCSDGSVKIWLANIEGLNRCTNAEEVPFALVAKVTTDLSAPVSAISLAVPAGSQYEINLAIGRVSGSLETWTWNTCSSKIENTNACHAHDQVVTGLSWGMDGYCLYSCSQDNSARCWMYNGNHLEEIPVHTNFPESKESTDLSEVSDRCFGITLAPGGQMIAVVRGLDLNVLDQMYQARTQKAVVEFIWIGGQFVGIPLDRSIDVCNPQSSILSSSNFLWWGSNILWSLKKYENVEKGLALWDVVAALQGFKKYAPSFLETLMDMWISALFSGDPQCVSINAPSCSRHDMLPSVSLRKLHLLNIICRKVMLSNHVQLGPDAENGNDSKTEFWNTLLIRSERELRERLVGFTFAAVLKRTAYSFNGTSTENSWFPVGVAQMDSWVSMNDGEVHNQLKYLISRIKDLGNRINSACGYSVEETCPYCSAPVHFESADVAICRERHTLTRCRASMILCSVLQPVWHCVCCGGMVDKLPPQSFFAMQAPPLDANQDEGSLDLSGPAVPLCPFCGVLLQRSTPAFLLSTSPV